MFRAASFARNLHRLFWVTVAIHGLDGLLEIIGAILMLVASRVDLVNIAVYLTAPELAEDPDDLVANYLRHAVIHLSANTKSFVTVYLLFNGLVKLSLMIGIVRGKLWAYPTACGLIGLFVCYQAYRISHTHSVALMVLMLIEMLTLYLIWREYRLRIRHAAAARGRDHRR